jgi:XTP/dITP diphosphohydrolase
MRRIVFATNNENKVKEIAQLLGTKFEILSLAEIGCNEELEETSSTLDGNARQKAEYVAAKYKVDCFADDTGLEIEALNNEPGVYSARYAGPQRDSEDNMAKVLDHLKDEKNRNAQFRTAICLVLNNESYVFEGIAGGTIRKEKSGVEGFGYDPIFQPDGYDRTFAEMEKAEKNAISHRGIAVGKMVDWLKEQK